MDFFLYFIFLEVYQTYILRFTLMLKRGYVLPPCYSRLFRERCTVLLRMRTTSRTTTSTHTKHAEKKYYIGSQKRLPKQTRNILVGKEPNLFKTVGLIRMKRTTMMPSFTASTIATFWFVNAGLAYIIIHLLQPRHILLITTTDGCVNPLMEMTKMYIRLLKCVVS